MFVRFGIPFACTASVGPRGRIVLNRADEDDPSSSGGYRYDSTLTVSAFYDLLVPRVVPPITRPAKEYRPIVAGGATRPVNYGGRDADAPRLVARSEPTRLVNCPEEIFAPELAAPIRRVVDELRPIVSNVGRDTGRDDYDGGGAGFATMVARVIEAAAIGNRPQEIFAPELVAPTSRIVDEPRPPASDAGREASGSESDVDPGATLSTWVDSTTHEDAIGDLGQVEYEDPTLAVDSLEELFAPEPVAPITPALEERRLPASDATLTMTGLESCFDGLARSRGTEANAKSGDAAVDEHDRKLTSEIQGAAVELQRFAEMFDAFTSQRKPQKIDDAERGHSPARPTPSTVIS